MPGPSRLLIAPGEGSEAVVEDLRGLDVPVELVVAERLPLGDGPAAIAGAIAGYERLGESQRPAAALVHGSGELTLGAAISLVKLEIPVARLESPAAEGEDLAGLIAERRIASGADLAAEVSTWLGPILAA